MEDYTSEELIDELAKRFPTVIVAVFDETATSQIVLFGAAGDLCILNANVGHAIISEADDRESGDLN